MNRRLFTLASLLRELDEEWDIERVLETGSSALTLAGLILSVTRSRRWVLLSLAVQGFFVLHALQGWCPPLPVFRRLGIRTQYEIEQERYALRAGILRTPPNRMPLCGRWRPNRDAAGRRTWLCGQRLRVPAALREFSR